MTPHRLDHTSPFARTLIAGRGIRFNPFPTGRDDLAAVKGMLVGIALGAVLWCALIALVIRQ